MTESTGSSEFRNETVIAEATFRKTDIISYQIASTSIIMALTIFGIVVVPFAMVLIKLIGPKIVDTWECTLTNRAVHVKKGLFIKVKKTIPLEKITDVGSVQGPIMRHFKLHALSFETAGQSGGASGALVKLLGITDSDDFRDLVLDTRDAVAKTPASEDPRPASSTSSDSSEQVLRDIRDSLLRIEERVNRSD